MTITHTPLTHSELTKPLTFEKNTISYELFKGKLSRLYGFDAITATNAIDQAIDNNQPLVTYIQDHIQLHPELFI